MRKVSSYGWALIVLWCPAAFFGMAAFAVQAATHSDLIPESLIHLNCEDQPNYALVVEKKSQTINVYECDGGYRLRHRFACSTGEAAGKKKRPGDRKTPEGVYFFTKSVEKRYLSSTYGNRAFVMDYPNALDHMEGRSGDSIWLHGTNKALKPRDTNGCVAVENGNIDILARYIRLNHTPIIIKKELRMVPPEVHASRAESLRRFLEEWKAAFVAGDKDRYALFYMNSPLHLDRMWETWEPIRRQWDEVTVPFEMKLKDIAIARANPCLVALLDQSVRLGDHVATAGRQKLFLEYVQDEWKIVAQSYQGMKSEDEIKDPLVASLQRLEGLRRDYNDVAERVAKWAEAWSAQDIERYRSCYSKDFHARGMDLASWIRYKRRLNRRYDFITVSVEDLRIEQNGTSSTATFVQRYNSSGHESVGTKQLRLKRADGEWKIDRERWFGTRR